MFHGSSGRSSDAGMEGSLLYHMAMVSKMAAESRVILEELNVDAPSVDRVLWRFYSDFVSDAKELLGEIVPLKDSLVMSVRNEAPSAEEKIRLFKSLSDRTRKVEELLNRKDSEAKDFISSVFLDWTEHVVEMRLRQEYETLKGFLIVERLADELGVEQLDQAMARVQKK